MMRLHICLNVLLLCVLTSCAGSPPVHYYTLESAAAPTAVLNLPAVLKPEASGQQNVVVGIAAVSLPVYLDRLPIVQRKGAALVFDNSQRWAEPLADAIPRVLAVNLATQLPDRLIVQPPWTRSGKPEWKITVQVERFEAEAGQVVLQATWSMLDADGHLAKQRGEKFTQTCNGTDGATLAAAHSAVLAAFSKALAAEIRLLPRR